MCLTALRPLFCDLIMEFSLLCLNTSLFWITWNLWICYGKYVNYSHASYLEYNCDKTYDLNMLNMCKSSADMNHLERFLLS